MSETVEATDTRGTTGARETTDASGATAGPATGKDADGHCVDEHGQSPEGCNGHGGCGGGDEGGGCDHGTQTTPLLDARTLDSRIRQSAIFGVLMGLPPGEAVTVVTPGDPTPIAELLNERLPGQYEATAAEMEGDIFLVTFERLA
ncbi:MAG: DUF2249 domain-containing protein [Dermatophilaceae bacterium]